MGVRESVCTVKEPLAHMSLRLPERDEPSEAGFPSPEAHFANRPRGVPLLCQRGPGTERLVC